MLEGKKLLILGATANEIPIIKRAQEMGIYTIVTDYNLNHLLSPAKDISDEYWDVSWSDLDTLEILCKNNHIDGVIAGYSEIRVDNMIELCERLNLPSYTKKEQLTVTRNKYLFKKECRKYGLPVIKEYSCVEDVDEYPVIVKPVDRAGSIGVGIAYNKNELIEAYDFAYEKSLIKQVIIEKYMANETEMDLNYAIVDGNPYLISSDDIIPGDKNQELGKVVQSVWLLPEKKESKILTKYNEQFINMIKGWGLKTGTVFFSAFINDVNEISVFECGYRLWGVQEFEYTYRRGLGNFLDLYIIYALTGESNPITPNDKSNPNLKCVEVNFYVNAGTIASISGIDKIKNMPDCTVAILDAYEGQVCQDGAILTKAALVGFSSESVEKLKDDVDYAYKTLLIKDTNGVNMLYGKINTDLILSWWN